MKIKIKMIGKNAHLNNDLTKAWRGYSWSSQQMQLSALSRVVQCCAVQCIIAAMNTEIRRILHTEFSMLFRVFIHVPLNPKVHTIYVGI